MAGSGRGQQAERLQTMAMRLVDHSFKELPSLTLVLPVGRYGNRAHKPDICVRLKTSD